MDIFCNLIKVFNFTVFNDVIESSDFQNANKCDYLHICFCCNWTLKYDSGVKDLTIFISAIVIRKSFFMTRTFMSFD